MKGAKNQLSRAEARRLFVYKGGFLYWRRNPAKPLGLNKTSTIRVGEKFYSAHYLIWNWHFGTTVNALSFRDGNSKNHRIENIQQFVGWPLTGEPGCLCPLCKSPMDAPDLDFMLAALALGDHESAILTTAWRAKGRPVSSDEYFNAIYASDPDGGPEYGAAIANLKVKVHYLNKKILPMGYKIVSGGYAKGYKLVMEGRK